MRIFIKNAMNFYEKNALNYVIKFRKNCSKSMNSTEN